jgi:perosamine synthetase
MTADALALLGGNPVVHPSSHRLWPQVGNAERAAVNRVLDRRVLSGGYAPEARAFERAFAAHVGVPHALLTHAGTGALELAVGGLGIGAGDEVIVPAYSFIASAMCVLARGAIPRFVDVLEDTGTIDPDAIEAAITPATKAVMAVHIHGTPADMNAIDAVARPRGLKVIEDAAQAHLATYEGRPCGSLGDTAAFSLQASKNLSAGEGGVFTTKDAEALERALRIRSFGLDLEVSDADGYTLARPLDGDRPLVSGGMGQMYRGNEMQAAFARMQLERLPAETARAQRNAARLSARLRELEGITPPVVPEGSTSAFHKYRVAFDAAGLDVPAVPFRDVLMEALRAEGVGVVLWQDRPLPAHPLFQRFEGHGGGWPFRLAADPEQLRASYDPSRYPRAQRLLDASIVLFTQSCPLLAQPDATVDLYGEAFAKVWAQRDVLRRMAHERAAS